MFKILIVDDNDNNRFSLKALLSNETYKIYEAANGSETLAIIMEEAIDLIILDVQLPDYNGFQLATMIKSRPSTKDIPIILATAVFKAQVFIEQGFEAGAVDYVIKPINGPVLMSKIEHHRKIIENQSALAQAVEALEKEKNTSTDHCERFNEIIKATLSEVTGLAVLIEEDKRIDNRHSNPRAKELRNFLDDQKVDEVLDMLKVRGMKNITIEGPDGDPINITLKTNSRNSFLLLIAK